jgi:hypothetical protein
MAMPPDGSSPWRKHDDVWVLVDDGAPFASLTVAVDGSGASVTMPVVDSPYDAFFVLRFGRTGALVTVAIEDDAPVPLAQLRVPTPRVIVPRRRIEGPVASAAPLATVRLRDDGVLAVVDARARPRLLAHTRGGAPAGDTVIAACGGALWLAIVAHPGTAVAQHASARP